MLMDRFRQGSLHHKFTLGPRYYQQKSYSFGIFTTPNLSPRTEVEPWRGKNARKMPTISRQMSLFIKSSLWLESHDLAKWSIL